MDVPPGDRIRFRALLLAAIAGAVATRGVLLWKFRGALIDSDEAVMGLMARNVLHGHIPIFFYGQSYMGSLEAFLAAAWFAISSATPFVLKLSTLTWFAAFLAAQHLLMRQVTDRATASMNTLLLAVSPAFLTVMSLKAWGYMSLLLLGTFLMTQAIRALRSGLTLERALLIGITMGMAWWGHFLAIVYISPVAIWLLVRFRSHWCGVNGIAWLGGFLVGSLPFWVYNIFRSWASFDLRPPHATGFWAGLSGFFSTAVPIFVGTRPETASVDFFRWGSGCGLLLFLIALVGPALRWRTYDRGRLLLLTFFALFPLVFAASHFGGVVDQPRYLLPLYSVFYGLLLMPLSRPLQVVLTALLLAININGTLRVTAGEMATTVNLESDSELLQFLKDRGVRSAYAPYWIAYRLTFESNETVICSPPADMGDRYHPYLEAVRADPKRAYIEFNNEQYDGTWMSVPAPPQYARANVGNFVIAVPPTLNGVNARRQ